MAWRGLATSELQRARVQRCETVRPRKDYPHPPHPCVVVGAAAAQPACSNPCSCDLFLQHMLLIMGSHGYALVVCVGRRHAWGFRNSGHYTEKDYSKTIIVNIAWALLMQICCALLHISASNFCIKAPLYIVNKYTYEALNIDLSSR